MNTANELGNYTSSMSKKIKNKVLQVNALKDKYKDISEDEFLRLTEEFKSRLRNGETIEDIMVDALAVAREATRQKLGMFPYDVQIEAAISMVGEVMYTKEEDGIQNVVREKVIAEMKTGEGKTLVQILIAYLNLLEATKDKDKSKWKSVHIMTANDALAKRDAESNGKVFELLGFSCDFVMERKSIKSKEQLKEIKEKKQKSYNCDVVYATATTIAFDYLDSNTVLNVKDRYINKEFGYAIVDEADDILLDKASTPLIISGEPDVKDEEYAKRLEFQKSFTRSIYNWATALIEEKLSIKVFNQYSYDKNTLFDEDIAYYKDTSEVSFSPRFEKLLNSFNESDELITFRYIALSDCVKAKFSVLKDIDYKLVKNEDNNASIMLIDSNTGRILEKTRYSNGMQDAIEAKELYKLQKGEYKKEYTGFKYGISTDTKAKCTYPDFLSLYKGNVCGMTGTSDEKEFYNLYQFYTYYVPTRVPSIRIDMKDEFYSTQDKKINAIIEEIKKCLITGQPVLIGTTSDKESLIISNKLDELHIRHQLLNTNNAHIENEIIKNAGLLGSITVATNMAGRGTDIKLGPGVKELGGLYVIGTTRNKSKRIDKQLRGRSARQGDRGKTKYFCSLEDEIVSQHFRGNILSRIISFIEDSKGRIKNKRIIREINRSLEIKESIDKQNRYILESINKVYTEQKNIIYKNRKTILEMNPKNLVTYLRKYIERYAEILVNNLENNIDQEISHLIDIDSIKSRNKNIYKNNLIIELNKKLDEALSDVDYDEYTRKMKEHILNIIDVNWHFYMQDLKYYQTTLSISTQGSLEEYNNSATRMFINELIPNIYNEIITYALLPDLKFGTYEAGEINKEKVMKL